VGVGNVDEFQDEKNPSYARKGKQNPKLPILVQGEKAYRHTRKGATLQNSQNIKVDVATTIAEGVATPPMMFSTTNDRKVAWYDGYDVKYTQKTNVEQAKSLTLFMANKVKCCTPKHQQLVMEKFLCHPLMIKGFLPLYLDNITKRKTLSF
jgi:hypothetical protein